MANRLLSTRAYRTLRLDTTLHDGTDKVRETQMLAIAEDSHLLRWKKIETPVIATPPQGMVVTGFRDPCPWREGDTWYLGIGSGERGVGGCVLLYRSRDLRHWEYLHKLTQGKPNGKVAANPCDSGEMWECPDFFEVSGQYCLFYSSENKVFWSTGEYDTQQHRLCGRIAPACSIMALTTRRRAFSLLTTGAFCGDGFAKRAPKRNLPRQAGPAPWGFRAC